MFAVIMAGGSGTRFWPASRERLPKQFLKITSDRTIFQETLDRVRHFASDLNIYAVVGRLHAELTRAALGDTGAQALIEPVPRNTAAAIGLAAIHIKQHSADEPFAVLPSDHFVANPIDFAATVKAAGEAARTGAIVTIGITPTRPETGYGYIEVGAQAGTAENREYFNVNRFVEKPNQATALEYLSSGRYLWNSGIFIFTAATILSEIEKLMPKLYAGLQEIESSIGTDDYAATVERVFPQLESISIDYGIMEKTARPICVFKGDFGWSDVGSWDALYELRTEDRDKKGNLPLGDVRAIDAQNNLVYSNTDRVVTLLGVEGLMVIDTKDALLVARQDRAQEVKKFAEILKSEGRNDLC
ncbi:MAG TPA: mannose-1-phosphate guanylyltransferase [Blastocatellia bacterium]|nr:mannose-1-phosphate guanylyltransferase [Blastocatellia bacterium]